MIVTTLTEQIEESRRHTLVLFEELVDRSRGVARRQNGTSRRRISDMCGNDMLTLLQSADARPTPQGLRRHS